MALSNYTITGNLPLRRSEGPQCDLTVGDHAGGYLRSTHLASSFSSELTYFRLTDENFTAMVDGSFTLRLSPQDNRAQGRLIVFHFLRQVLGEYKGFALVIHTPGTGSFPATNVKLGLWEDDAALSVTDIYTNINESSVNIAKFNPFFYESYYSVPSRFPVGATPGQRFTIKWTVENPGGSLSTDVNTPSLPIVRFDLSGNPQSCDEADERVIACIELDYNTINALVDTTNYRINTILNDFGTSMLPFLLQPSLGTLLALNGVSNPEGLIGNRVTGKFIKDNLSPLLTVSGELGLVQPADHEEWGGNFDQVSGWTLANGAINSLAILVLQENWEPGDNEVDTTIIEETWPEPTPPTPSLVQQENWES